MDTSSSGSRKRKAYICAEMESVGKLTYVGSDMGAVRGQSRAMSASPKRLAMERSGSDISCQSHLLCEEGLDQMTLESILVWSPSADTSSSGTPSSLLSITTAGTSKSQLSDEGKSECFLPALQHQFDLGGRELGACGTGFRSLLLSWGLLYCLSPLA